MKNLTVGDGFRFAAGVWLFSILVALFGFIVYGIIFLLLIKG